MTPRPSASGGSSCELPSARSGPLPFSLRAEPLSELPADRGRHYWWWPGGVSPELLLDGAGPLAHRARAGSDRGELAQQSLGFAAPDCPELVAAASRVSVQ